jgi:hypothetical protein
LAIACGESPSACITRSWVSIADVACPMERVTSAWALVHETFYETFHYLVYYAFDYHPTDPGATALASLAFERTTSDREPSPLHHRTC